jgi:hypothetical protein
VSLQDREPDGKRAKVTQEGGELGLDKNLGCGEIESWGSATGSDQMGT